MSLVSRHFDQNYLFASIILWMGLPTLAYFDFQKGFVIAAIAILAAACCPLLPYPSKRLHWQRGLTLITSYGLFFMTLFGAQRSLYLSCPLPYAGGGDMAERLRQLLSQQPLSKGAEVSASFAVSEYRCGESLNELICQVDQAQYRAKQSKDCVLLDENSVS